MPEVAILNMEGKKVGQMALDSAVFAAPVNVGLMHQAVRVEEWNRHQRTASTKTRAEVRGGGRKPWRQKGTGRARHGSTRSPIWTGGGVVFGPRPRDTRKKMPKRMRRQALRSALTAKLSDGHLLVLDELRLEKISTRRLVQVLENLALDGRVLLLLPERDEVILKSADNVVALDARFGPGISTRDVLLADHLVFTRAAVEKLQKEWAS
jgi:large subunit ribosomal protein L4